MNNNCTNCQAYQRIFCEKEYSCSLGYVTKNGKSENPNCPAPKTFGDFCRALRNR